MDDLISTRHRNHSGGSSGGKGETQIRILLHFLLKHETEVTIQYVYYELVYLASWLVS